MFNPEFIQQVTLFAGFVIGAVEGTKRLLKKTLSPTSQSERIIGTLSVCFSIIVSASVCLSVLDQGFILYLSYTVCTCLSANGLFKAFHTPSH